MGKSALYLTLAFMAVVAHAQQFPIINQPVFGFFLGETAEGVAKRLQAAGLSIDTSKYRFAEGDHPGKIGAVNGTVNKSPAVSETKLSFYGVHVYAVELVFKDTSEQNFSVLQKGLQEQYGAGTSDSPSAGASEAIFRTAFDGKPVTIFLSRDVASKDQSVALTLSYTHDQIAAALREDWEKRKAAKGQSDPR